AGARVRVHLDLLARRALGEEHAGRRYARAGRDVGRRHHVDGAAIDVEAVEARRGLRDGGVRDRLGATLVDVAAREDPRVPLAAAGGTGRAGRARGPGGDTRARPGA